MCQEVTIRAFPDGACAVRPGDCAAGGPGCREASAPYIAALGAIAADAPVLAAGVEVSHVAAVAVEVKDLDALERACASLGLRLERGRKTWKWFGRWVNDYHGADAAYHHGVSPADYGKNADHVITVPGAPGAYEIGVYRKKDGTGYLLAWDWYAGGHGLCARIAHNADRRDANKLVQAYAVQAARGVAGRQQHRILHETPLDDGSIRLRVRVSS